MGGKYGEPWEVEEADKFPWNISVSDSDGEEVLFVRRHCHSSRDQTLDDVMSCRNHGTEQREQASAWNHKQLARIKRANLAVNACAGLPDSALEQRCVEKARKALRRVAPLIGNEVMRGGGIFSDADYEAVRTALALITADKGD